MCRRLKSQFCAKLGASHFRWYETLHQNRLCSPDLSNSITMSSISFLRFATICGKACTSQLQASLLTTSLTSTSTKVCSLSMSRFLSSSRGSSASVDPYQERVQSLQDKTEASLNQMLERSANHSPAEVLAAQLRTDGSISTPPISAPGSAATHAAIVSDSHEDEEDDDEEEADNVRLPTF